MEHLFIAITPKSTRICSTVMVPSTGQVHTFNDFIYFKRFDDMKINDS